MSDRKVIELAARAIAANAEMIARSPNDYADDLQKRADQIRRDLSTLDNAIRDLNSFGGDR